MLRLRLIHNRPEEPVDVGDHTAELVDVEGNIAATGHVVADADVALGNQQIIVGLTFVGQGTLGRARESSK